VAYGAIARAKTPYNIYWAFATPAAWLMWAGLPVAALGIVGLVRLATGQPRHVFPLALVVIMVVWAALPANITTLRPGEVERTWAFLYPVVAATAGPVVDRWTRDARGPWSGVIVAGLVVISLAQTVFLQSLWDNLQ
jgi:hypothetical protein